MVVSVDKATLTVSDIERRLRNVPSFQLADYGSSPAEVRSNSVDRVLVPELSLSEEAKRRGTDKTPLIADRVRGVLAQALDTELRKGAAAVTPDEIKSYYDANRHRFNTPRRIKIWRILVGTEAAAKKILSQIKGSDTEAQKHWSETGPRSQDGATSLRGGDLGFVAPTARPRSRKCASIQGCSRQRTR